MDSPAAIRGDARDGQGGIGETMHFSGRYRAALFISSVAAAVILHGCSSQSSGVGTTVSATASATASASCPPRDIGVEVKGRFTDECLRKYITWGFRLPQLREFDSPIVLFNPTDPQGLTVYYNPVVGDVAPHLLLEIFPSSRGLSFVGTEYATSPRGFEVNVGGDSIGFGGAWDDGDSYYVLDVVDASDTPEVRAIIFEAADSVLAEAPVTPD